jgi:hypothetical protein
MPLLTKSTIGIQNANARLAGATLAVGIAKPVGIAKQSEI